MRQYITAFKFLQNIQLYMSDFTPPIQRGIFLKKETGEYGDYFVVGAGIKNPTGEEITLRTMNGSTFNPRLKEKTFTQEGQKHLWSPNTMTVQAVTNRVLKPNKKLVHTWTIPNAEMAYQNAVEEKEELNGHYEFSVKELLMEKPAVEPSQVGIVQVKVGYPALNDCFDTLTKQYDLRSNPERKLDEEIPESDEDAMDSTY